MPVLTEQRLIHTKARGVTEGGQSILLEMYSKPELIQSVFIKDGTIYVTIENPFGIETTWKTERIGHLKDEYLPLMGDERIIVKSWRITGGNYIEGYHNFRAYLGINISFKY